MSRPYSDGEVVGQWSSPLALRTKAPTAAPPVVDAPRVHGWPNCSTARVSLPNLVSLHAGATSLELVGCARVTRVQWQVMPLGLGLGGGGLPGSSEEGEWANVWSTIEAGVAASADGVSADHASLGLTNQGAGSPRHIVPVRVQHANTNATAMGWDGNLFLLSPQPLCALRRNSGAGAASRRPPSKVWGLSSTSGRACECARAVWRYALATELYPEHPRPARGTG